MIHRDTDGCFPADVARFALLCDDMPWPECGKPPDCVAEIVRGAKLGTDHARQGIDFQDAPLRGAVEHLVFQTAFADEPKHTGDADAFPN